MSNKTSLDIQQLTRLEEILTAVNQNRGMSYDAANFYARMYFFCEYPGLGHCFI